MLRTYDVIALYLQATDVITLSPLLFIVFLLLNIPSSFSLNSYYCYSALSGFSKVLIVRHFLTYALFINVYYIHIPFLGPSVLVPLPGLFAILLKNDSFSLV